MTTTDGDLQRFAAKITKAEFGRDRDRGHFTLCITLDFGGSGQCFVSPVLGALATRRDETGAGLDFLRRVPRTPRATRCASTRRSSRSAP